MKWTKQEIRKEASKYKSLADFYTYGSDAYSAARNHGILKQVTKRMIKTRQVKKIDCIESAAKCKTFDEWNSKHPAYFIRSRSNAWMDEIVRVLGTKVGLSEETIKKLERQEKRSLKRALNEYPNQAVSAQSLGLSHAEFILRLKKYNIKRDVK